MKKSKSEKIFFNQSSSRGFSILEVVSAIFIFIVVFTAIYGSFNSGLKSLIQSRYRVGATQLANEKMEIIRNLPYDEIGVVEGVPAGSLLPQETVWRSNQRFMVSTDIAYVDDSLDGTEGGSPDDSQPKDYKKATVEVLWSGVQSGNGVKIISKFVPNGVENESGGGTMSLNVIDSAGQGVSGADVQIVNNSTVPPVSISTQTDTSGNILRPGMPVADRTYEIAVSKAGYESVSTLPPYPITAYSPADIHGTVVEDALNSKTIIIDLLGSMNISSVNFGGSAVPNIDFSLRGGRVLGLTMEVPPATVFGYGASVSSGESGTVTLSDMAPGNYSLELVEPGYVLIGTEAPLFPFYLYPDQALDVTLLVADSTIESVLVTVKNSLTNEAVSGAEARLFDESLTFDQTLTTGDSGRVYFPPNLDPPVTLGEGEYNLEVSADGYDSFSGTVNVENLVQPEVNLVPI